MCRHYPAYSLTNIWDLTPKQLDFMYRSLNREKRDTMETEIARDRARMQFEARIHGIKKPIQFTDDEGEDGDHDDSDVKENFASLDAHTARQIQELRTKAATEGAFKCRMKPQSKSVPT